MALYDELNWNWHTYKSSNKRNEKYESKRKKIAAYTANNPEDTNEADIKSNNTTNIEVCCGSL